MELRMRATNVYRRTVQALKLYKIICEEGGSRSSKTFSIFQVFIVKALEGEKFSLTIARDKLTWIKPTLLKDFDEITQSNNIEVYPRINPNRQDQIYYINGSEFAFFGLDYAQKLHGRKQDYFWLNEVMEISKTHFDQLEMRTTKQGILDYNPIDDTHWVFDLHKRPDVGLIRSTMLDNPFNPPAVRNKILSYEPTAQNIERGTADSYMWDVYGLGKKAKLKGVIFTNWDIVDDIPEDARPLGLGLDFGFSNHPSALIDCYLYDNEIYLDELIYQTGLTNLEIKPGDDSLEKRMKELDLHETLDPITGDSAEPKSLEELKRAGFNVEGAEKGSDSVTFGIDLMKSYKIHITKRSINLEKEMRRYKWLEDKNGEPAKRNGKSIPIDDFNHAIDAARYRLMRVLKKKTETKLYPTGILG